METSEDLEVLLVDCGVPKHFAVRLAKMELKPELQKWWSLAYVFFMALGVVPLLIMLGSFHSTDCSGDMNMNFFVSMIIAFFGAVVAAGIPATFLPFAFSKSARYSMFVGSFTNEQNRVYASHFNKKLVRQLGPGTSLEEYVRKSLMSTLPLLIRITLIILGIALLSYFVLPDTCLS